MIHLGESALKHLRGTLSSSLRLVSYCCRPAGEAQGQAQISAARSSRTGRLPMDEGGHLGCAGHTCGAVCCCAHSKGCTRLRTAPEARACRQSARLLLSGSHALAWSNGFCRRAWFPCKSCESQSLRGWPTPIPGQCQQSWLPLEVDIFCLDETRLDALGRYLKPLRGLSTQDPACTAFKLVGLFDLRAEAVAAAGMARGGAPPKGSLQAVYCSSIWAISAISLL